MKVTAILKDFSDQFYNGTESGSIPAFLTMTPGDKWEKVRRLAADKRVSLKIGTGQFRDQVELNQILRNPVSIAFKIEPRRGYKLATFDIVPADCQDSVDWYPAAFSAPR